MDFLKCCLTVLFLIFSNLPRYFAQSDMPDIRPRANTTKGEVIGWFVETKTAKGKYMKVFKGIPYAKPPVNELRFLDPLTAESWTEAKSLSQDDPSPCPQVPIITSNYSEDCLFVNVYTPQNAVATSKLPVMVFIYGGKFEIGASLTSMYGSDYLLEQNIIFVSMNYRVGAFGFLNLGTDNVPGNAGLKDQLLALKWVQTEISNFGGDPAKVTIFGNSAGSASVTLQYLSPKTENLFRAAIAQSGNALAEWPFMESGFLERAKALSELVNCKLIDNSVDLSCLQNVSMDKIIANQNLNLSESDTIAGNIAFPPSLEKPRANAILSDTPANLLANLINSTAAKRPLITGINKDEGMVILTQNANYYKEFYDNLKYLLPERNRINRTDAAIEKAVEMIKSNYFNNFEPTLANLTGYINVYTDTLFGLSTASFARKLAASVRVYLYHFDFSGDFKSSFGSLNISGVAHGEELGYIFWASYFNQSATNQNSTSMKTLRRMVKMWTNFAKTGNPTPNGTTDDDLGNFLWLPITNGASNYLRITEYLNMSTDNFEEDALSLWDKIYSTSSGVKLTTSFVLVSILCFIRVYFV